MKITKHQNTSILPSLTYPELVSTSDSLWREMSSFNFPNGISETLDFKRALNRELGQRTWDKTYNSKNKYYYS